MKCPGIGAGRIRRVCPGMRPGLAGARGPCKGSVGSPGAALRRRSSAFDGRSKPRTVTRPRPIDVLALLSATTLWTAGALRKSLWSDEFHSLHHVRAEDWGTFLEAVRSDNHPPLSFALQRLSVLAFGESELALRLPSVVAGLVALVLVARVSARLPERSSRRVALWFVACSSYLFTIATEARMYALLLLCVLGLAWAVLERLEGRGSRAWVASWVALGLHTHYYFLHDLFVLGACAALAALVWPGMRRKVVELLWPATLGVLFFLPWASWGFLRQLQHGLPAGGLAESGSLEGLAAVAESLAHLAFFHTSLGGSFVTYAVALPGTLVVAALGFLGIRALVRAREPRVLLLVLLGLGIGAPLWSYAVSLVVERANYGYTYIAGSAGPVLLLVAAGVSGSGTRLLTGACALGAMLAVTLAVSAWGGEEDYRAAVEFVLDSAEPGDAVLAKPLWDLEPERSPTGWDYYAARAERTDGPRPEELPLAEIRRAYEHPRVWLLARDGFSDWALLGLRRRYASERRWRMGTLLRLYLFAEPRSSVDDARATG